MQLPAIIVHGGAGVHAQDLIAECDTGCRRASEAAWRILEGGGGALDAVTRAVTILENDPVFNAGVGACLTSRGTVELDASVMDGRSLSGAGVGAVSTVANPVLLAREALKDGRHVLLVGKGAEALAVEWGLPTVAQEYFITERQLRRWRDRGASPPGTVGAVAVDVAGHTAAATSTGGILFKLPGRVGDSAVIGAGTYADDRAGAASATGPGEAILMAGLAKTAVDLLRYGVEPATAARHALRLLRERHAADAGIILVDRFGRVGVACQAPYMPVSSRAGLGVPAAGGQ
jgi:beta-aspartyl-peptidase (threonine type)